MATTSHRRAFYGQATQRNRLAKAKPRGGSHPYKNPCRLVAIWDKNVRDSGISKNFDSFQDFREVTQHASSFEEVAAATWAVGGRLLSGRGFTRGVFAMPVSESFFPLLGVAPALGRTFATGDSQRGCSVVLSDRLWRKQLAADPKLSAIASHSTTRVAR